MFVKSGASRRCALLLALIAVVLFAFVGASFAAEKVIKVGALFPLTGPAAVSGQNCLAAVETAAEIVNGSYKFEDFPLAEKAGLLDGYKIVVVPADHQGKPDVAKSEAERLFNQEKVFAIVGSYNSSASKPASAVAERMKRIFMCGCSSSAALTERNYKYFFRHAATDGIESEEFVDYIQFLNKNKNAGIKTLGLIYENSEFGKHAADEGKKAAAAAGIKVVADIPFTVGATNMNSEVQQLKSANPDAVFGAALGSDYSLWIRTMKQVNWMPKIAINYCTGYQNPAIAKELGKDGNFLMGGMGYSPELAQKHMKAALKAQEIYMKKTSFPLDSDSIQEAVVLHILAQAIEKAGAVDTEKVAKVLRTTTFDSPMSLGGKVAFTSPGGQNNKASTVITQLVDLKYKTVFPESYADAEPIFPIPAWDARK